MPPSPPHRPTVASIATRVDDHEHRIEDLEARLSKYDAIIVRLDTLIDILTKRVEDTANKAEDAIEGQELLTVRNESAYRWSAVGTSLAVSFIVGLAMFLLGYFLH